MFQPFHGCNLFLRASCEKDVRFKYMYVSEWPSESPDLIQIDSYET